MPQLLLKNFKETVRHLLSPVHTRNNQEFLKSPKGASASTQGSALRQKQEPVKSSERAPAVTKPGTMPQSLSKVYTHIIFSTKHRRNLIDEAVEPALFDYLRGVCKALECHPIQVGGYQNHVHILCLMSRKIAQMNLLEEVKKRSSKWIKTKDTRYSDFYWQDGYGIFSVKPSDVERVAIYIRN